MSRELLKTRKPKKTGYSRNGWDLPKPFPSVTCVDGYLPLLRIIFREYLKK
jgi:hypothetical protein